MSEMVDPQTRKWLKLSGAETADWQLNSKRETADSGNYLREAKI